MKKIVRTNLTAQISSYIQDEIIKGTWKPGEKLPSETELAETLGVSRMSLRSAGAMPSALQKPMWEKAPLSGTLTCAPTLGSCTR